MLFLNFLHLKPVCGIGLLFRATVLLFLRREIRLQYIWHQNIQNISDDRFREVHT